MVQRYYDFRCSITIFVIMKHTKFLISAISAAFVCVVASAKVELPSVLSSGMVLQQNTDITLWGKASPGHKVSVKTSWNGRKTTVKAGSDGRWECSVPSGAAGGPYTIEFSDGEKTVLEDILLGEVWFCSGQSNMEMPVAGFYRQAVEGSYETIAAASESTPIRMFLTDQEPDSERFITQSSPEVQDDLMGKWFPNSPQGVSKCSAVAYFFARRLQSVLGVPVGLVVATRGGTWIETWISREALEKVKPGFEASPENRFSPTYHFNGKIAPLTRFAVAGFIWYQGESNQPEASEYSMLFQTLVADWRARWGRGDLPFYSVQIAPYHYDNPSGISAALIREQQQMGAEAIANGGIVCTLDIGSDKHIHPPYKIQVGDRLAFMALAKHYGRKGYIYESPSYDSMTIKDGKALIRFRNAPHGIGPMFTEFSGFEIAGADRVFHPAHAVTKSYGPADLEVWSPEVGEPVAVRYCFHNLVEASVFEPAGLPLFPFRTDDWDE